MKAILEFEAPESCEKCRLSHLGISNPEHCYCSITRTNVRYYPDHRAPDCPLEIIENKDSANCMKPATTLKELLKPPFCSQPSTNLIRSANDKTLLDVPPYAWLKEEHAVFKNFVVAALNEKWERDFGEPLRWITRYACSVEYLKCPKCSWDDLNIEHETIFNCCPFCGQRLFPPEEAHRD